MGFEGRLDKRRCNFPLFSLQIFLFISIFRYHFHRK